MPKDITSGADRGYGVEIYIGHPDAEGGILLERSLSAIDLIAKLATNPSANQEKHKTEY